MELSKKNYYLKHVEEKKIIISLNLRDLQFIKSWEKKGLINLKKLVIKPQTFKGIIG